MTNCTRFLLFFVWFNDFVNSKISKWCECTNLHLATGASVRGVDFQWSVHVIQMSVVAYELLQICNILRSRVGNSTQKLREFAALFHSDGLGQILPAAHSSGFHPSVGRPTLITLVNTQNVSVTNIVDSSSIQCAETKYGLRLQFLALVVMIHEVWLNA